MGWRFPKPLIAGIVITILAVASFPLANFLIYQEVKSQVLLVNGTQAFKVWEEPSVDIYFQAYVFHLGNAEEVLNGAKPYLVQKGPYTYKEHRKKVDLIHSPENGTIQYRQIKTYTFDREKSVGPDTEKFTTINLVLMTIMQAFKYEPSFFKSLVSLFDRALSEEVFVTKSVHDIVWGYTDPVLELGTKVYPKRFYTSQAGILAGKNYTDDGVYTVFTGEKNLAELGVISLYNDSSYVKFWSTPYANMVNGTDGTVGPPFISEDTVVKMFSTDICRSVYGTYNSHSSTSQGIPFLKFTAPKASLEKSSKNPDNAGFCTPPGNCLGTGVLNISTCQTVDSFHVPVIVSYPHFYMADKQYVDAIQGLNPNGDDFSTSFGIEPVSGLVLEIYKRLQINIFVEHVDKFSQTKNVRSMVFPVLWVNESAIIDDANAAILQNTVITPLFALHVGQYVLLAVGIFLILFSVIILVKVYFTKKASASKVNNEVDNADESAGAEGDDSKEIDTENIEERNLLSPDVEA